jgi:hypothetical protein
MPLSPDEFRALYPQLKQWIEATLATHAAAAQPVATFGFERLPRYYRPALLAAAKVVAVDRLPVPPLTAMGLPQFAEMERMHAGGITYLDTYFATPDAVDDESLHFHELIHVVQWRELGPERFLATYADGLERCGYRASPLEIMAYDAQARFDRGECFDAEAHVRSQLAH